MLINFKISKLILFYLAFKFLSSAQVISCWKSRNLDERLISVFVKAYTIKKRVYDFVMYNILFSYVINRKIVYCFRNKHLKGIHYTLQIQKAFPRLWRCHKRFFPLLISDNLLQCRLICFRDDFFLNYESFFLWNSTFFPSIFIFPLGKILNRISSI